ncbi:hypothetical protein [Streptacidiphilus pinicola]|uniref:hypothetical protein n=1 Tax=Streptacidiphilus pinicola TaxID=2219663 RepID=UPI0026BE9FF6
MRTVGHGGAGNGQFAELLLVPERGFAVSVMSNGGPGGVALNLEVVRFALEHYLGVVDRDPEPVPYVPAEVAPAAGVYEIDVMTLTIRAEEGAAAPTLEVVIKPEIRSASPKELPGSSAGPGRPPRALSRAAARPAARRRPRPGRRRAG